MRSLVGLVRAAGSSLLITSETGAHGFSGNALDGLVFLFDNVIDLRYIEEGSHLGRALYVAKMRRSKHKTALHTVTITDSGLVVGNEIESVTGRLGWSVLRTPGLREPSSPSPGARPDRPDPPAPAGACPLRQRTARRQIRSYG